MTKDLARLNHKKSNKPILIIGLLTVIVIFCSAGIFWYSKVYKPRITKKYIQTFEPKAQKVSENITLIEKNTNAIFFSKDKDSFKDLNSAINTGKLQADDLIKSCEDFNRVDAKKTKRVDKLNSELKTFSDMCIKFGEEYSALTEYFTNISKKSEELSLILGELPIVATSSNEEISKSLDNYSNKKSSLVKIEKDIKNFKTNSDTDEYNNLTLELISRYSSFFDKTIKSLKDLQDLKKNIQAAMAAKDNASLKIYNKDQRNIIDSFSKYQKELAEELRPFDGKTDEYASKIGKSYLAKLDLLKNESDSVKEMMSVIKIEVY